MATNVYTLEVAILEGPVTAEFIDEHPQVMRAIEIRGDQTLEKLHQAIFEAFDRFEQHMYEFQFGDGPHDCSRGRYTMRTPLNTDAGSGDPAATNLDALGLEEGQFFGYWFDFGDDWYHQIYVLAVGQTEPKVKYPRVVSRIGDSPPQYADWDEDGDYDDEDDYDEDDA